MVRVNDVEERTHNESSIEETAPEVRDDIFEVGEDGCQSFANNITLIREKSSINRLLLQQQQAQVAKSTERCTQNDEIAVMTMTDLMADALAITESAQSSPTTSTAAVSTAVKTEGMPTKSKTAEPNTVVPILSAAGEAVTNIEEPARPTARAQIEGFKELLIQLTSQNPKLHSRVLQLAIDNPKLRELDIFQVSKVSINAQKQQPQKSGRRNKDKLQNNIQAGTVKTRHDSELSSVSSSFSLSDVAFPFIANGWSAMGEGKKKGRRQANSKKASTKKQATEEKSLVVYINTIVAENLKGDQKERSSHLTFKGGVGDLEAYAKCLVDAGLGRIVEEEIRVNKKNNRQAFVVMSNGRHDGERDGMIFLPVARRYAFDGDIVRAFVMHAENAQAEETAGGTADDKKAGKPKRKKKRTYHLSDEFDAYFLEETDSEAEAFEAASASTSNNCPKAFVTAIVKQTDLSQVVGTISFKKTDKLNGERSYYKFRPNDMRVPMIYIPADSCSAYSTDENKTDIGDFLFVTRISETDLDGHCIGELVQAVGKVGSLEAEVKAILLHNGLRNITPYEERFNEMFAEPEAPIDAAQHSQRDDLRGKCIFTIDPLTARDLDDAMSVERINDNMFEVGVHISDVSHYLTEDSELDMIVKNRATSIYLVNEVVHMLPQPLCFKCSLLPGEDKFAFSVFWTMNASGLQLTEPRFTRSIIKSCTQLAYEDAQKIIDNPNEAFNNDDDLPTICNGFGPTDIVKSVRYLHGIAQHLRTNRYINGALAINNPKLRFTLDVKSGEPLSYQVDGRQEANYLIEEFMLLANQSVAQHIFDRFPDIAILRNHGPPLAKSMKALRDKLASLGLPFDYSSSKTVYESMQRLCREAEDPAAMDACLNTLLTKPMARAKYFCSEGKTLPDLWHYALSIPIYTHFTSPIRRYPDILVHRLLAAALNYCQQPKRTVDELHHLAKICNDQKFNAKNASDESNNLFFKRYITNEQSITLRAVVTEIFQYSINVTTIETGHCIPINYKMQKMYVDASNAPEYIQISGDATTQPQRLHIFSTTNVKLTVANGRICGFFASSEISEWLPTEIGRKKQQLAKSKDAKKSAKNAKRKQRHSQQAAGQAGCAPCKNKHKA